VEDSVAYQSGSNSQVRLKAVQQEGLRGKILLINKNSTHKKDMAMSHDYREINYFTVATK
jgi:hypothetical protein